MANEKNYLINTDPLYSAIAALAHTVDRQLTLLDRLTAPEPSLLPELLPFVTHVAQLFVKPPMVRDEMGPAERVVMAELEAAHAKLVLDFAEKRAAARAKDEATRRAQRIVPAAPTMA